MSRVRHLNVKGPRRHVQQYVGRTMKTLLRQGVSWRDMWVAEGINDAPVCTWAATLYWREAVR